MQKIEHIGIAVNSLEEGEALYESLLGVKPYKREEVLSEKVTTSFFRQGPNKIELLAPIGEDGPISKYLAKKGPGMHHIAYAVNDILAEMERLRSEGFHLLNEEPKRGADNKYVCFVHPKTAGGVLVELCQEIPD
ncbi:MAG: methylmalonyl-CoA/ethylmalonyl-CoA epimerase [Saprospiraceae bacterium]|jgi:methylmalonyl-CoA/ethylmalonyl-CoA epimerase|tara:strand:+ start:3054 stop:3458 length:405 start_codon:yes stop_codon:yes gene_type:complete